MSGGLDDHDLALLRGRWSAAEAHIYPLAMVSVPAYEQAVSAVGVLLDVLRAEVQDLAGLIAFHARPTTAFERLDPHTLGLVGLRIEDLVDAACASRDRELAQQEDQQRRVDAVRAARAAGEPWADVPARRSYGLQGMVPELRVHLASRRGLRSALEADPDTGDPRLRILPVEVDLDTGALSVIEELDGLDLLVSDRVGWEAAFRWFAGEWDTDVDAPRHP